VEIIRNNGHGYEAHRTVFRSWSREPKLKRPPAAGTEITKCGSGSFLFTKDSKKFYFKNPGCRRSFCDCYNFNTIKSKKVIFKVPYLIKLTGAGAGAVIRICGFVEPEIFSAQQHWSHIQADISAAEHGTGGIKYCATEKS
jgi:hypothetical protein